MDMVENMIEDKIIFVYNKTERLISALYLVTNLFHDSEPLKWSLRDRGVCLLCEILPVQRHVSNKKSNEIRPRISELISMLKVANRSGILSDMNYRLLEEDFIKLHELVSVDMEPNLGFSVSEYFQKYDPDIYSEKYSKKFLPEMVRDLTGIGHSKRHGMSDRMSDTKTRRLQNSKRKKDHVVSVKKGSNVQNRRNQILKLAKKNGSVTVTEVVEIITDCSEKTIQRDLVSLVNEGVLDRNGERRWTRYSPIG